MARCPSIIGLPLVRASPYLPAKGTECHNYLRGLVEIDTTYRSILTCPEWGVTRGIDRTATIPIAIVAAHFCRKGTFVEKLL